jgi:hypothetical protein
MGVVQGDAPAAAIGDPVSEFFLKQVVFRDFCREYGGRERQARQGFAGCPYKNIPIRAGTTGLVFSAVETHLQQARAAIGMRQACDAYG